MNQKQEKILSLSILIALVVGIGLLSYYFSSNRRQSTRQGYNQQKSDIRKNNPLNLQKALEDTTAPTASSSVEKNRRLSDKLKKDLTAPKSGSGTQVSSSVLQRLTAPKSKPK